MSAPDAWELPLALGGLPGLQWSRPSGLGLLLAALLLLLLARHRSSPVERATGTLALWQEVARRLPPTPRARRLPPLPVVFAALAITFAALALAGPHGTRGRAPRVFTLLCDRSPSVDLPIASGGSRFEAALGRAREALRAVADSGDRVVWRAQGRPPLELPLGERPPGAWFANDPGVTGLGDEVDWSREDRAGVLWVTDRASGVVPRRALLFASGGEAVSGPVASRGGERIRWDGEGLVSEPCPPRAVVLESAHASALGPLLRFMEIWAHERGFRFRTRCAEPATAAEGGEVALLIRAGVGGGDTVELIAGSSSVRGAGGRALGWSLVGTGGERGIGALARGGSIWCFARAGKDARPIPVVAWAPGELLLGLRSVRQIEGDPALFAYAWSRFLDSSVRPAKGVVSLAERRAAGPALFESFSQTGKPVGLVPRRWRDGVQTEAGTGIADRLAVGFAGAAALLAALAFGLSLRPARLRSARRRRLAFRK